MQITEQKSTKRGFTLIELTLAVAFISVLLITITLITNEIINLYRKGYSIKTINQTGRDIIEDLTMSIQSAPPSELINFCSKYSGNNKTNCEKTNAQFSIYQEYSTQIQDSEGETKTLPYGGVFCTGKYSYIWNTGYLYNEDYKTAGGDDLSGQRIVLRYGGTTISNIRLLKVEDISRTICSQTIEEEYPADMSGLSPKRSGGATGTPFFSLESGLSEEPTELLKESDTTVALYDLSIFPPAESTKTDKLFFTGSFILGTIDGGVDILSSSNFCKNSNMYSADFSYCAINKFNFGTQASGI